MYRKMNLGWRVAILFVLSVFFASNAVSSAVLAVTQNQAYTQWNVLFYDPSGTSSSCAGTENVGSLTGNSDEERGFRFLVSKGLTDEQAAGVVGNLMVESGMVPDNQEDGKAFGSGGWGIAQWTGSRRDDIVRAVQNAGLPYTNEKTPKDKYLPLLLFELNFLWTEATKRGDIAKLKQENTVDGAVLSWERNFEIAGKPALGARGDRAHEAYNKFHGVQAGTSTDGTPAQQTDDFAGCGMGIAAGDFVYYSQYDSAWASKPYGSSGKTILESGCGPTSMAMIISTLTGQKVTPDKVASWGGRYYIPGQGSSHDLFPAAAKNWGLRATFIGKNNESAVKDVLGKGGMVVGGGSGSNPYTGSGHVIVIRGVTTDGKYIVGNPLPPPKYQGGTASAEINQDSAFMDKTYTWAQLSTNSSGMYSVVKP